MEAWWKKSQSIFPGGVNSPMRSFRQVGSSPLLIMKGEGAYLWDSTGKKYLDFVSSWGACILGHSSPGFQKVLQNPHSPPGYPSQNEISLGEEIQKHMPSIEQIRFTVSGTEACMHAVRLARGYTGKRKILKFLGHFHGSSDSLLLDPFSSSSMVQGIPQEWLPWTLAIPFNNQKLLEETFALHGNDIAAVIFEPIATNHGVIPGKKSWIHHLKKLCEQYGSLLIADEVVTGFRVGLSGAQGLLNFRPDITILGKIIGGGLPVGAYGGRRDIMSYLAPQGPIYQGGTFAGHPLVMACGLYAIQNLQKTSHEKLHYLSQKWILGLEKIASQWGISLQGRHEGGLAGFFFQKELPWDSSEVSQEGCESYKEFFRHMLAQGVYLPPSPHEPCLFNLAFEEEDVVFALKCAQKSFQLMVGRR